MRNAHSLIYGAVLSGLIIPNIAHSALVPGNFYGGATLGVPSYSEVGETDVGYKFFGGYQLYDVFGLELSRVDLGGVETDTKSLGISGWNMSLAFTGNITPQVSLTGRLGSFVWSADNIKLTNQDDGGNDISYGVGVLFNVSDNFYLRGDLDLFKADEESVNIYSFGIMAAF